VLLTLTVYSASGLSFPDDHYFIWNQSNEPIYITSYFKRTDGEILINIDYFVDERFITKITGGDIEETYRNKRHPREDMWNSFRLISFNANRILASNFNLYVELFHYLIEDFIIYDKDGHIIIKKDDITIDNFTFKDYSDWCSIMLIITQDMIEEGRRKAS
jgi:hypothetical protein